MLCWAVDIGLVIFDFDGGELQIVDERELVAETYVGYELMVELREGS